ncbi:uncharacterized protein LOC110457271 [Mizuhopecten yessoensis]|uniref:uncharacterized protein LOC110457271 n=1 Tax=Mizuhopecten yessoensis TaxID=6573 RepID=UPI000B4595C6|nr:uncharacterized protein LOC110457271 [Mizuhopecten yessoensis]
MVLLMLMSLLLVLPPSTECLTCYQCADTQMDGPCQRNTADLVKSNQIWKQNNETLKNDSYLEYIKTCPPEQNYCVIERIEDKSVMFAYIRECSDGVRISINNVDRFQNMTFNKNNFTTCAFKWQVGIVCITLCEGNLCNGPIVADVGNGQPVISSLLLITALCWSFFCSK